jgi:hypothetical protein
VACPSADAVSALAVDIIGRELSPTPPSVAQRDRRLEELQALGALVGDASDVARSVERMVDATVDLVKLAILVEGELQRLKLETQAKRDRLTALAPGAVKMLEGIGVRIDALIERASAIDPRTCPPSEITWRNRLLDLAHRQSETLNDGIMKLLS